MRKLVLLLFFLILFLLYSTCSDCPTVDNITSGKILDDFKGYFDLDSLDGSDQKTERDRKAASVNGKSAEIEGDVKATEKKESNKDGLESKDGVSGVESIGAESLSHDGLEANPEEKSQKLLDLTLPQFVDDVMDMSIFKYEYKSMLPDLFTPSEIEEEESRTSFGGRVLMEEGFEELDVDEYRLQDIRGSIEGAEITLEVKTN